MIPFIRSITELMAITQPGEMRSNSFRENKFNNSSEDIQRRKELQVSKGKKPITLPNLPKNQFIKSRESILKILDELDYNNQIQSSYDLTLMERQSNGNHREAA